MLAKDLPTILQPTPKACLVAVIKVPAIVLFAPTSRSVLEIQYTFSADTLPFNVIVEYCPNEIVSLF